MAITLYAHNGVIHNFSNSIKNGVTHLDAVIDYSENDNTYGTVKILDPNYGTYYIKVPEGVTSWSGWVGHLVNLNNDYTVVDTDGNLHTLVYEGSMTNISPMIFDNYNMIYGGETVGFVDEIDTTVTYELSCNTEITYHVTISNTEPSYDPNGDYIVEDYIMGEFDVTMTGMYGIYSLVRASYVNEYQRLEIIDVDGVYKLAVYDNGMIIPVCTITNATPPDTDIHVHAGDALSSDEYIILNIV